MFPGDPATLGLFDGQFSHLVYKSSNRSALSKSGCARRATTAVIRAEFRRGAQPLRSTVTNPASCQLQSTFGAHFSRRSFLVGGGAATMAAIASRGAAYAQASVPPQVEVHNSHRAPLAGDRAGQCRQDNGLQRNCSRPIAASSGGQASHNQRGQRFRLSKSYPLAWALHSSIATIRTIWMRAFAGLITYA